MEGVPQKTFEISDGDMLSHPMPCLWPLIWVLEARVKIP